MVEVPLSEIEQRGLMRHARLLNRTSGIPVHICWKNLRDGFKLERTLYWPTRWFKILEDGSEVERPLKWR